MLRNNAKQTRTNEKVDTTRGQEKSAPPKRREEKAAPPTTAPEAEGGPPLYLVSLPSRVLMPSPPFSWVVPPASSSSSLEKCCFLSFSLVVKHFVLRKTQNKQEQTRKEIPQGERGKQHHPKKEEEEGSTTERSSRPRSTTLKERGANGTTRTKEEVKAAKA